MASKIITDAQAKSAAPIADRQVEYPDAKVGGLALRVAPTGRKTWSFRYRNEEGKQRRISLGLYPATGLADARQAAWDTLGAVAKGADPAAVKRAARTAAKARTVSTVQDLVENYLADAEKGRHRPEARPKRPGTLRLERDYFDRLIRPRLGALPVADLTRALVQAFLDDVAERTTAGARHCRNLLRQVYNYAIRRELADSNPVQFAQIGAAAKRERVLSDDELRAIWGAATVSPGLSGGVALAIRLAMLTLQRGGEIIGIHAGEVDKASGIWTIPGERTKNHQTHVVPLSGPAIAVLDEAFAHAAAEAGKVPGKWQGFAFPSPRGVGPVTRHAFSRAAKRVTTGLGIADATPHDFRRTGSTNITGERIGMPRFMVSRVLNHISDTGGAAAVTGVYDRNAYLPDKRKALDAWAALLTEIVSGVARSRNIMRLRAKDRPGRS